MELGQIIHNNPIGAETPDYVDALIKHIRDHLARAYWNTQQQQWEGNLDNSWGLPDKHGLTPLPPGIEWRHYYNWGGLPEDENWNQSEADAPNFAFEGVEIRWYKRFGRSMNTNVAWGPEQWVRWFERCVQTIRHWEDTNCSAFAHRNPTPLPDPADRVPITEPDDQKGKK